MEPEHNPVNIFDGYNVLTVYHIWAMVMVIIALMATITLVSVRESVAT